MQNFYDFLNASNASNAPKTSKTSDISESKTSSEFDSEMTEKEWTSTGEEYLADHVRGDFEPKRGTLKIDPKQHVISVKFVLKHKDSSTTPSFTLSFNPTWGGGSLRAPRFAIPKAVSASQGWDIEEMQMILNEFQNAIECAHDAEKVFEQMCKNAMERYSHLL